MPVTALVTLDEAYDTLNESNPDGTDDVELLALIDAVTGVVENIVGPVIPRDLVEFYDGGTPAVVLGSYPVLTVTSVTEYTPQAVVLAAEPFGTSPFTGYGYRVDLTIGRITRTSGGLPRPFYLGTANVAVAYTAGRGTVPANVKQAARDLIRLHWQPQQSGNLPGIGNADEFQGTTVQGYFVPYRVLDLLAPYRRAPVVA